MELLSAILWIEVVGFLSEHEAALVSSKGVMTITFALNLCRLSPCR
jgi:hypothetical protein